MLSRVFSVTLVLLLWWASATPAVPVRPALSSTVPSAVEQVERLVAVDSTSAPSDAQPAGDLSGSGDGSAGALDMPAMLMAPPAAPVFVATTSVPSPYTAAAWAAPDLGVPQRPPSATTVVA